MAQVMELFISHQVPKGLHVDEVIELDLAVVRQDEGVRFELESTGGEEE